MGPLSEDGGGQADRSEHDRRPPAHRQQLAHRVARPTQGRPELFEEALHHVDHRDHRQSELARERWGMHSTSSCGAPSGIRSGVTEGSSVPDTPSTMQW
jgi:hypothetical protein